MALSDLDLEELDREAAAPVKTPPVDLVRKYSTKYGVDPSVVLGVMKQESGFDPGALSGANAAGYMQMIPSTFVNEAKQMGYDYTPDDRFDPEKNIDVGVHHIASLLQRYGSIDNALKVYKAGPAGVKHETYDPYVKENTSDYVRKVKSHIGKFAGDDKKPGMSTTEIADFDKIAFADEPPPKAPEAAPATPPVQTPLPAQSGGPTVEVKGTSGKRLDELGIPALQKSKTEPVKQAAPAPKKTSFMKALEKEFADLSDVPGSLAAAGRATARQMFGVGQFVNMAWTYPLLALDALGAGVEGIQRGASAEQIKGAMKQAWDGERDSLGKLARWVQQNDAAVAEKIDPPSDDPYTNYSREVGNVIGYAFQTAIPAKVPLVGGISGANTPVQEMEKALKITVKNAQKAAPQTQEAVKSLRPTTEELTRARDAVSAVDEVASPPLSERETQIVEAIRRDADNLTQQKIVEIRDRIGADTEGAPESAPKEKPLVPEKETPYIKGEEPTNVRTPQQDQPIVTPASGEEAVQLRGAEGDGATGQPRGEEASSEIRPLSEAEEAEFSQAYLDDIASSQPSDYDEWFYQLSPEDQARVYDEARMAESEDPAVMRKEQEALDAQAATPPSQWPSLSSEQQTAKATDLAKQIGDDLNDRTAVADMLDGKVPPAKSVLEKKLTEIAESWNASPDKAPGAPLNGDVWSSGDVMTFLNQAATRDEVTNLRKAEGGAIGAKNKATGMGVRRMGKDDPLTMTPDERSRGGWIEVWRRDRADKPEGFIKGSHWGTLEQANAIAKREEEAGRPLGKLRHAYIKVTNPFETYDGGFWEKPIKEAEAKGHDAIIYENEGEGVGGKSYIPLSKDQIREIPEKAQKISSETGDLFTGTEFADNRTPAQKALDNAQKAKAADKLAKRKENILEGTPLFDKNEQEAMGAQQATLDLGPTRKRGILSQAGAVGGGKQEKIATPPVEEAIRAQRMFDKQRADVQRKFKFSFRKFADKVASGLYDVAAPVKHQLVKNSYGKKALMHYDLSRGASAEALRQYDSAEKTIYKFVPQKYEQIFADYLQAKRTIEVDKLKTRRGEAIAHPDGAGAVEMRAWINELKKQHPNDFDKIEKGAEQYWKTMRDQLDQLKENGLITEDVHKQLVEEHPFYSPRRFLQHIDPEGGVGFDGAGRKINVPDSGIKRLEEGSEESMMNDPRVLLNQVIARTQTRIFKNRANKALYEYAKETPDNPLGIIVEEPKSIAVKPVEGQPPGDETMLEMGKASFDNIPAGKTRVSAVINGQRVSMLMPDETARYWITSDPLIDRGLADVIRVVSGSAVLKPLATGMNPEFAIANLPRDIAHAWLVTGEYNPVAPVGLAQMAADFVRTAKDAWSRKGRAEAFVKEGGGMDFLTNQGAFLSRKPGEPMTTGRESLTQMQKVLSYLGESSELWTRLALRERALRNGKSAEEATHIARTYIDFAQGGSWVKAADTAIPYLNASVQGTRAIFRAFKENPSVAAFKVAQIVAFGAGLVYWNRKLNLEAWDAVTDREKESKWIFTTPFSYMDKNGAKRFHYIAIPKDQGQRVFGSIGEALMDRSMGGDAKRNWAKVTMAASDYLPVDASTMLPPTMSAFLGYVTNKDFWANEDVWKGRKGVSPKEEYYNSTPDAYIKAGEVTGLSPERMKMAVGKVVPANVYTYMLGGAWDQVTSQMDPESRARLDKAASVRLAEAPGVRKILRTTPGGAEEKDTEASVAEADKRIRDDRKLKLFIAQSKGDGAIDWLSSLAKDDPKEAKRLITQYKKAQREAYKKERQQ